MIKRLLITICLIGCGMLKFEVSDAQNLPNFGIFIGTSYYLGDINPNRHFYRPSPSLGAFYRYNLNTRYAFKYSAYYAHLSGSDLDFPDIIHSDRPLSPASFSTSLVDIALQVEYNFLPFTPYQGQWAITPYISTGIAGGLILSTNVSATNLLSIPFGAGFKVNISSHISAGAEWTFRKTFSDRIDGVENSSGTQSILHNNDWYSYLGVFITFKFFNFATECPAYN
jgi:hypothetical protein